MLNKVFLQGRLVANPEMRHTQQRTPVASFRLAVDRDFKDKQSGKYPVDFINIVAWRSTAEFVCRYFAKGRMMIVDGRLQMRNYEDRDGNKRIAAEVIASNIYFGDSKRDGQDVGSTEPGGYTPPDNFGAPTSAPGNGFAELNEDDGELPF